MLSIVFFFWIWIYFFIRTSINFILPVLFFPLLIILWLTIWWWLTSFITIAFTIIVFIYLVWFNFVEKFIPNFFRYIFFIILWIFIFLMNSFNIIITQELSLIKITTVSIVSFVFLFNTYYFSIKKNLWYLYSIWTFFW
jgi:hypothetical protein